MQARVKATPRRRKAADTSIARLKAVGIAYLEFAMQETGLFNTAFAVPGHMEYAVKGRRRSGPDTLSGAQRRTRRVGDRWRRARRAPPTRRVSRLGQRPRHGRPHHAGAAATERFGQIGEWASPSTSSCMEAEPTIGATRTCQIAGFGPFKAGTIKERLVRFDPGRALAETSSCASPQP
jgi:hypothetical protein